MLLKNYTTFGIGGPARFFKSVTSPQEMREAFQFAIQKKIKYFVLGKGSNCLFGDGGFDGLVILNAIDFYRHEGTLFEAGAGFSFSLLGSRTARAGFRGLEFASGIPGSVGGAVFMNAGANGIETKDYLKEVVFMTERGEERRFERGDIEFRYRFSSFHEMKGAILSATFELEPCSEAKKRQVDIVLYRKETQPYGEKSAGCLFRNNSGESTGGLIEKCGLKGLSHGDAVVSPKHANFIVNRGNASAEDVLRLAQMVKDEVKKQTGITLDLEVRYVPS